MSVNYVCTVLVEALDSLELEFQMFVSLCVGAGN